jgi:hypothetical protein
MANPNPNPLNHEALLRIATAAFNVHEWLCKDYPVLLHGSEAEVNKVRPLLDEFHAALEPMNKAK